MGAEKLRYLSTRRCGHRFKLSFEFPVRKYKNCSRDRLIRTILAYIFWSSRRSIMDCSWLDALLASPVKEQSSCCCWRITVCSLSFSLSRSRSLSCILRVSAGIGVFELCPSAGPLSWASQKPRRSSSCVFLLRPEMTTNQPQSLARWRVQFWGGWSSTNTSHIRWLGSWRPPPYPSAKQGRHSETSRHTWHLKRMPTMRSLRQPAHVLLCIKCSVSSMRLIKARRFP